MVNRTLRHRQFVDSNQAGGNGLKGKLTCACIGKAPEPSGASIKVYGVNYALRFFWRAMFK